MKKHRTKKRRMRRKDTRAQASVLDGPTAARSVADIGKGQTLDDLTVQDFDRVTALRMEQP
jgi:hypothetical protein